MCSCCLCRLNHGTVHYNGAVCQLKLQGPRLSKLFQNLIGVLYARDLNVDPVIAFLINLCLSAVAVHTLLQFVNGVCHVLCRRSLISHCLVGNAHTACQVQSSNEIFRLTCSGGTKAYCCGKGQKP